MSFFTCFPSLLTEFYSRLVFTSRAESSLAEVGITHGISLEFSVQPCSQIVRHHRCHYWMHSRTPLPLSLRPALNHSLSHSAAERSAHRCRTSADYTRDRRMWSCILPVLEFPQTSTSLRACSLLRLAGATWELVLCGYRFNRRLYYFLVSPFMSCNTFAHVLDVSPSFVGFIWCALNLYSISSTQYRYTSFYVLQ